MAQNLAKFCRRQQVAERRRRGLPLLLTGLDYNGFLRAMKVSRPTGAKYVGVVPYAPRDLVPFLLKPGANPFRAERERAVFLLRIDALLRPGEVRGILRSSIRDVRDPLHRLVVAFNYSSKQSERQHAASDSNYCSHSCQPDQGAAPRNLGSEACCRSVAWRFVARFNPH